MKSINFFFKHPVIRYITSGGIGAVTNLGMLFILTHFIGFYYIVSGIIAFICSVFVSFYLQKKWTFKDNNSENTHRKFVVFTIIAIVNLGANTLFLFLCVEFLQIHYMLGQIIASGIVAFWSYFLYKSKVFGVKKEIAPLDISRV